MQELASLCWASGRMEAWRGETRAGKRTRCALRRVGACVGGLKQEEGRRMIGDGENKRREDNGRVACGEKEDGAGCARRTRRAWAAREMRAMACDGPEGENMRRAGDLTLIKRFVLREDDGRDTRLGACLAERCVP